MYWEQVVVGKRVSPTEAASAEYRELRYLPATMENNQGPTAWRRTENPLDRMTEARVRTELVAEISRSIKRGRTDKKKMFKLMDAHTALGGGPVL